MASGAAIDYRDKQIDRLKAENGKLRAALEMARLYLANELIGGAIVVPLGEEPRGDHPTLLQTIDAAIGDEDATALVP